MEKLNTLPEFIAEIPAQIDLQPGEQRVILTDTLESCTVTIPEGANLTFVSLMTEGWDEKKTLNFNFTGKGAYLSFIGLIIATDEQKFQFETLSNHEVPETNAYYYTRSTQLDKSRVHYRGSLNIKPKAQLTDSYLAHHTLMLSPKARVETIPSLEIEADDVKAGHAATLGQVDEETLHYMTSRGLDEKAAKDLMIKGFMEAELHMIPSEAARLTLVSEIEGFISPYL